MVERQEMTVALGKRCFRRFGAYLSSASHETTTAAARHRCFPQSSSFHLCSPEERLSGRPRSVVRGVADFLHNLSRIQVGRIMSRAPSVGQPDRRWWIYRVGGGGGRGTSRGKECRRYGRPVAFWRV